MVVMGAHGGTSKSTLNMYGCYRAHGGTSESELNEMGLEQSDKDFIF